MLLCFPLLVTDDLGSADDSKLRDAKLTAACSAWQRQANSWTTTPRIHDIAITINYIASLEAFRIPISHAAPGTALSLIWL